MGRKTWGREGGEGDEGITKLKTNVTSTATERKLCLLLGEACLAACSRGWQNDIAPERFLFVFSLNPEMLSLHREEEWKEQGGLY